MASQRNSRLVLLLRQLLCAWALAVAGGCGELASEPSPDLPFEPAARSQDLLCALQPPGTDAAADAHCRCDATEGAACELIEVGGDRRRARLLPPGRPLALEVDAPRGGSLRFAAAALGDPGNEVELRVTLGGQHSQPWSGTLRSGEGWRNVRLEVVGQAAPVEVEIEAADTAPGVSIALAMPRLVAPVSSGTSGGARLPDPTNVIVYMIDTLRPDHMSLYGYPRETTPRLERFARDAVTFERAFSSAPRTRPSTGSLFTSLQSSFHGAQTRPHGLTMDVTTLAERFREGGWSTWAFVTNGHVFGAGNNFDQGFDRFVALPGAKGDNHARTAEVNKVLFPHLDELGDEPFMLYLHTVDPHSPYDPPLGYAGRFRDVTYAGGVTPARTLGGWLRRMTLSEGDVQHVRDLYDEEILYQDAMFGALVDRLEALDLLDQTVVIVLSDHGEEFMDHGRWAHGERLWEEQLRIPLMIRLPHAQLAGLRVNDPVQILDVMPTLLRWFGLPGADTCQGADLSPTLWPGDAERLARPIYAEELRPDLGLELVSLREEQWKILRLETGGTVTEQIYNLASDPLEQDDRSAREPQQLERLRQRLEQHRQALAQRFDRAIGPVSDMDESTRKNLEALGYLGEPEVD